MARKHKCEDYITIKLVDHANTIITRPRIQIATTSATMEVPWEIIKFVIINSNCSCRHVYHRLLKPGKRHHIECSFLRHVNRFSALGRLAQHNLYKSNFS